MNKESLPPIAARFVRRLWLCALVTLLVPPLLTELLLRHQQNHHQELQQRLTLGLVRELGASLEYELAAAFQPSNGLASYVAASQGKPDLGIMEPWLVPLTNNDRHLRNVAIAPGNTVTYVYPLAGNESAIGLHYPRNKDQWPEIERIILGRRPMLTGPLPLVQGGQGLIYRVPVYLNQHYWGIVSTVINADTLFAKIQASAELGGLRWALIEGHDNPRYWRLLWGDAALLKTPQLSLALNVPGRDWRLHVAADDSVLTSHWPWRLAAWLAGLFCASLVLRLHRN